MTATTKRLAEALRDVIHDSEKGQVPGDGDLQVLREFLSTAAQEANVQGGELCVLASDLLDEANEMRTLARSAAHSTDERKTFAWCAKELELMATQTTMRTAAPHPTPAPASGEVTDADFYEWWRGQLEENFGRRYFRAIAHEAWCQAATRARQGEGWNEMDAIFAAYRNWPEDIRAKLSMNDVRRMGGWIPSNERENFVPRSVYEAAVRGRQDFRNAYRKLLNAQRDAAPNAADAEAYRAAINKAADWVRDRRFAWESENGYIEPDTNAMSFGTGPHSHAKEEYDCELVEIEEGIRALAVHPNRSAGAY